MILEIMVGHDEWHLFLWVWVSANQKISLSVLARNPHKGLSREISHETGRGREKEGSRENRTEESREKNCQQKRVEQGSQQKNAGSRACGHRGRVGQRERMSAFLMALWEFRSNIRLR